jgi:hypothetical protein
MIAKSASRFSEKITLEQKVGTGFEPDGFEWVPPARPGNEPKDPK